ncbi:MAG: MFS transporter, partial [Paracoccaceae bacterium]
MTRVQPLMSPVLLVGCFIILISFAIRASFGVFQIPIADEFAWARSEFSMAIAIQNLFWGIGQPIFGAMAEKIGDRKAIIIGAVLYATGLVASAYTTTPFMMQSLEVLVGFGIAGTGFGVILAVVGRAASDENRSMALAIATAAGSAGQIVGPPLAEGLLSIMTWQSVFIIFAGMILAALFTLPMMRAPAVSKAELEESMGTVLKRAFKDPTYALIFMGFFSCGYQLSFVTAHFPAMVTEMCGPIAQGGVLHGLGITTTSALGAIAIAVIGFFNIAGTLMAGWLGNRYSKKYLLAGIYTGRTIIAAAFIMAPITPMSVLIFSAAMGTLWLATVPLTSGLVAHIYGLRYMGTLYGFVFFSHQLGSFLGVW